MSNEEIINHNDNTSVTSTKNASINMFRIICAIMVVIIHTSPFADINNKLGIFINDILPRIAVPFFFAVIGYFYIKKLQQNKNAFAPYFLRLLTTYTIWSCIYFVCSLFINIFVTNFNLWIFIREFFFNFFSFGTHYHLWFFPAVFLGLTVITLAYKFRILKFIAIFSLSFYILALLGSIYFDIGFSIPIINKIIELPYFYQFFQRMLGLGLNFMLMGYWLNVCNNICKKNNIKVIVLIIITIALFVIEIVFAMNLALHSNVKISIFLYPLVFLILRLLIDNPLPQYTKISIRLKDISSFMYYSHPIFQAIFFGLNKYIIKFQYFNTICCVLTILSCIIVGNILIRLNNKYLNRLYK